MEDHREIREAVEEGKTAQFLRTKIGSYECEPHWVDWNSWGFCFQEGVRYRVKPEEKQ